MKRHLERQCCFPYKTNLHSVKWIVFSLYVLCTLLFLLMLTTEDGRTEDVEYVMLLECVI